MAVHPSPDPPEPSFPGRTLARVWLHIRSRGHKPGIMNRHGPSERPPMGRDRLSALPPTESAAVPL